MSPNGEEDFNQELNALREKLPTAVEETAASKSAKIYYSVDKAEEICRYVTEGRSLTWISRNVSEMPDPNTILRWRRENSEFSKMLRSVREARARQFEDMAIEAAESAEDPRDVPAARLKFDAYKWGAEVNDPGTYGKKIDVKGSVETKTTFQVVTGFGPPNKWQTPPKLRPDGTIDKSYEDAIDVPSEVAHASVHKEAEAVPEKTPVNEASEVSGPGDASSSPEAEPPRHEGSTQGAGLQDAADGSIDVKPSGLQSLQSVEGHTPSP